MSAGRVVVVGAGVVGLSCAVRLLESGHRVDVVARDLPLETTSAVAAAIWAPSRSQHEDRETRWARASFSAFGELVAEDAAGVVLRLGTEVYRHPAPDPGWVDPGPRLDRETSLPTGYVDGWTFRCPVVEMPHYLRWLAARVESLGGTITRANLSRLPSAEGVLVVNATGLASRHFAGDHALAPVRGQVVSVEQVGLDRWWFDSEDWTYVVPRSRDIVLGGTRDDGEWSRTPDPGTTRAILDRAGRLVPELEGARVLRSRVGLRPARPTVRLERVGDVVHCYGHGGTGVTLSWGCADEVVELAG